MNKKSSKKIGKLWLTSKFQKSVTFYFFRYIWSWCTIKFSFLHLLLIASYTWLALLTYCLSRKSTDSRTETDVKSKTRSRMMNVVAFFFVCGYAAASTLVGLHLRAISFWFFFGFLTKFGIFFCLRSFFVFEISIQNTSYVDVYMRSFRVFLCCF